MSKEGSSFILFNARSTAVTVSAVEMASPKSLELPEIMLPKYSGTGEFAAVVACSDSQVVRMRAQRAV